MSQNAEPHASQHRLIKAPQDFFGGLLMIAIAAIAVWFGQDLPLGTTGGMGPGMMPRSVAVLLAGLGAALLVGSLVQRGPGIGAWSPRGLICVLAAILIFAYAVRPLGVLVAAPLCLLTAALGSNETRWGETAIFTIVMTALCVGLFKFALRQPIPLAPWLVGY
jgi:putative tricarboxylic transport membrane protein